MIRIVVCISDLYRAMVSFCELFRSSWMVAQAEAFAGGQLHDIIIKHVRAESMLKAHLLDMFVVAVVLVPLPLLKTTSGNPSSMMSPCLASKGLLRKRKNLRYPFLASGVSPKRTKNNKA